MNNEDANMELIKVKERKEGERDAYQWIKEVNNFNVLKDSLLRRRQITLTANWIDEMHRLHSSAKYNIFPV